MSVAFPFYDAPVMGSCLLSPRPWLIGGSPFSPRNPDACNNKGWGCPMFRHFPPISPLNTQDCGMWVLFMVYILPKHVVLAPLTHVPSALKSRECSSIALFSPLIFLYLFQGSIDNPFIFFWSICLTCPFYSWSPISSSSKKQESIVIQNQNQTDQDFSLSSATCLLCDSREVTYPLWASVS